LAFSDFVRASAPGFSRAKPDQRGSLPPD
jgi:hypothetical protein